MTKPLFLVILCTTLRVCRDFRVVVVANARLYAARSSVLRLSYCRTVTDRAVVKGRTADVEDLTLTAQAWETRIRVESSLYADDSLEPYRQEIPFHCQLANLGVKDLDVRDIFIGFGTTTATLKAISDTLNRLLLECRGLAGRNFVLAGNLPTGQLAVQSFKSNFRLELCAE